jgi:hypothetical protein
MAGTPQYGIPIDVAEFAYIRRKKNSGYLKLAKDPRLNCDEKTIRRWCKKGIMPKSMVRIISEILEVDPESWSDYNTSTSTIDTNTKETETGYMIELNMKFMIPKNKMRSFNRTFSELLKLMKED